MTVPFALWKIWNRTRYYWPQAKTRKRAVENLRRLHAAYGEEWNPPKPWWRP